QPPLETPFEEKKERPLDRHKVYDLRIRQLPSKANMGHKRGDVKKQEHAEAYQLKIHAAPNIAAVPEINYCRHSSFVICHSSFFGTWFLVLGHSLVIGHLSFVISSRSL